MPSWSRWKSVPRMSAELISALRGVPHLDDRYVPCAVKQNDKSESPCVVFVERDFAKDEMLFGPKGLGIYFRFDPDRMIEVASVAEVRISPFKLPLPIEKMLREHGPTHAAGYLAKLVLKDGKTYWHAWGEQPWFVSLPEGYRTHDLIDVVFPSEDESRNVWSSETVASEPRFRWCVYSGP